MKCIFSKKRSSRTVNALANTQNKTIQRKVDKVGVELEFLKHQLQIYKNERWVTANKGDIIMSYANNNKFEGDGGHIEFITKESDNYQFIEDSVRNAITYFNSYTPDFNFRFLGEESQNIGRPQVTMQISKNSIHDFITSVFQSPGLSGTKYKQQGIYKEPSVYMGAFTQTDSSQINKYSYFKNKVFQDFIDNDINQLKQTKDQLCEASTLNDFNKALDLAIYSVIQIHCAIHLNAAYFKGRFPFLSRTSLFSMYTALSAAQQDYFKKIIDNANLTCKTQNVCDNDERVLCTGSEILNSISTGNFTKSVDDTEQPTDALSSDAVNGGKEGGVSIGAMPLPPNADAIIECRYLPYVDTSSPDPAISVIKKTIDEFDKNFTTPKPMQSPDM